MNIVVSDRLVYLKELVDSAVSPNPYDYEGRLENVAARAQNMEEVFCNLVEVLARKEIILPPDLVQILGTKPFEDQMGSGVTFCTSDVEFEM